MAPGTFGFRADQAGLEKAVRNLLGQFQNGNQAMKRVNERSVRFLKGGATQILKDNVKRERDFRNDVGLMVVDDDEVHYAGQDRFDFWVLDKVDSIDARVRSYYRAIDQGSRYWKDSGRYVALVFLGNPSRPVKGGVKGGGTQAAYGDRRGARVLITRPVPAYSFLSGPVADFRHQGLYAKYVREEFARIGLKVKVSATP